MPYDSLRLEARAPNAPVGRISSPNDALATMVASIVTDVDRQFSPLESEEGQSIPGTAINGCFFVVGAILMYWEYISVPVYP